MRKKGGMKTQAKNKGGGKNRVVFESESEADENEQSEVDCECPICGVDFKVDEENVYWTSCDKCLQWWHADCLGLTSIPENYFCDDC